MYIHNNIVSLILKQKQKYTKYNQKQVQTKYKRHVYTGRQPGEVIIKKNLQLNNNFFKLCIIIRAPKSSPGPRYSPSTTQAFKISGLLDQILELVSG